jgi:hypothetical protein
MAKRRLVAIIRDHVTRSFSVPFTELFITELLIPELLVIELLVTKLPSTGLLVTKQLES